MFIKAVKSFIFGSVKYNIVKLVESAISWATRKKMGVERSKLFEQIQTKVSGKIAS